MRGNLFLFVHPKRYCNVQRYKLSHSPFRDTFHLVQLPISAQELDELGFTVFPNFECLALS
jgi:hypothetical protein